MEERSIVLLAALIAGASLVTGCSGSPGTNGTTRDAVSGAVLFATYCATCHPGGGNVINPSKTLQRLTLAANGITTPEGIIARVRNPGPGMKRFDPEELSDEKARSIAVYVLDAFQ